MSMRVAFLGPAGTFSEDALLAAPRGADIDPLPRPSVYAAGPAAAEREAARARVPLGNSIAGAVRSTLHRLAFEAEGVTMAADHDHRIHHSLIARREIPLERVEVVPSHPQASAQCARLVREE